jgi:hypothetical protein
VSKTVTTSITAEGVGKGKKSSSLVTLTVPTMFQTTELCE